MRPQEREERAIVSSSSRDGGEERGREIFFFTDFEFLVNKSIINCVLTWLSLRDHFGGFEN